MQNIEYKVTKSDTTLGICKKYNITLQQFVNNNRNQYPKLISNPLMIYVGWTLSIPLIDNGGNVEYKMFRS